MCKAIAILPLALQVRAGVLGMSQNRGSFWLGKGLANSLAWFFCCEA